MNCYNSNLFFGISSSHKHTSGLQMNLEIAEISGAIVGDGHLSRYISPKRTSYSIQISGNPLDDYDYFIYLSSLFEKNFNKKLKFGKDGNSFKLYTHSKEILNYFESIGINSGKKANTISIPRLILKNKNLKLKFLRGLADTDFSVTFKKGDRKTHSYPRIVAISASKYLIRDVMDILNELGISYCQQFKLRKTNFGSFMQYRLDINGKINLLKWINYIGFSNSKHLSKIALWQKLGSCPPNTRYIDRINFLYRLNKS